MWCLLEHQPQEILLPLNTGSTRTYILDSFGNVCTVLFCLQILWDRYSSSFSLLRVWTRNILLVGTCHRLLKRFKRLKHGLLGNVCFSHFLIYSRFVHICSCMSWNPHMSTLMRPPRHVFLVYPRVVDCWSYVNMWDQIGWKTLKNLCLRTEEP